VPDADANANARPLDSGPMADARAPTTDPHANGHAVWLGALLLWLPSRTRHLLVLFGC
jgi:hypothetical protein